MSLLASDGERQAGPAAGASGLTTPGGRWVFDGLIGSTPDDATSIYSSRRVLVTVLGELVLPNDGSAWTQTLIDAMACCGVSEKATRHLLTRSEDRGWLGRSRAGRRTKWHLTETFGPVLEDGAARIYRHGTEFPAWDGRWSVAIVSMPNGEGDRHRLTTGMHWSGYGSLGNGVWISPSVDAEHAAARAIVASGARDPVVFRSEVGALGDDLALARRAWRLTELERAYRNFRRSADHYFGWTWSTGDQTVRDLVGLVHQWRHFPTVDPGLPRELLPEEWPLAAAADCFAAHRAALVDDVRAWWLEREDRYGRN